MLAGLSERLESECAAKEREIHDKAGVKFNINSPKQLGDVLFNKLNLPKPMKYGKGKTISTAQDVLESLAAEHEVPRLVLDYRQLSKLKSTYVDALPVLCRPGTNRLHTSFNQAGTATGRLSSYNPNLQNIPDPQRAGARDSRRLHRRARPPAAGGRLLADRTAAAGALLRRPVAGRGLPPAETTFTRLTASQVFGVPPLMIDDEHRRRAKAVNFGIVYGLSPVRPVAAARHRTREAKKFIDAYFEKYTGVRKFIDQTLEQARREGHG